MPLAELFTLLETAPWTGQPFNPSNPRGNMLIHTFGERGLATYLVLEEQREVYLIRMSGHDPARGLLASLVMR